MLEGRDVGNRDVRGRDVGRRDVGGRDVGGRDVAQLFLPRCEWVLRRQRRSSRSTLGT